jgi:hypothetical protein
MERDDNVRSAYGVVICMRDMSDSTTRPFYNDVKADRLPAPKTWSHDLFFTFSDAWQNQAVDSMTIADQVLTGIGAAVVTRLLALNKRVKV